MKKVITGAALVVALGFATAATAITPPAVTQPKPGLLSFSWIAPAARADGSPLPATEIKEYRLYLTNEAAPIVIPAPATTYNYTVPIGYVTKSTDMAAVTAVDKSGAQSAPSASIALPEGVTTPKSLIGAPTSLTVIAR